MRYLILLLALLVSTQNSFAIPAESGHEKEQLAEWNLTDLSKLPELAAFFNNAHALLTIRPTKEDKEAPETHMKPTVFIFKVTVNPKIKLSTKQEWNAFLSKQLKSGTRIPIFGDASTPGRYLLDVTASLDGDSGQEKSPSDMRSIYLALHEKNEVIMFVYDGVGPSQSANVPLVYSLYASLNSAKLAQMYTNAAAAQPKQP